MASRFLLGCLAATRTRTVILDTSSFYGANMGTLARSLSKDFLRESILITPRDDERGDSITEALAMKTRAILIDDLNSLRYLLSSPRQRSETSAVVTLLRLLSFEARVNNRSVYGTLYKTDGESAEKASKRSVSSAADVRIFVDDHAGAVGFRSDEVDAWPNGRFSAPLYLEPST